MAAADIVKDYLRENGPADPLELNRALKNKLPKQELQFTVQDLLDRGVVDLDPMMKFELRTIGAHAA